MNWKEAANLAEIERMRNAVYYLSRDPLGVFEMIVRRSGGKAVGREQTIKSK